MYSVCLAIVIPLQRVQAERRRQRDENKQRLEMDRKKTACVPRRLPRLAGVFLWISRSYVFGCHQLKRMKVLKDPSSSERFALLTELLSGQMIRGRTNEKAQQRQQAGEHLILQT